MELGNQIKALRLARGVTQETLAEKLGVSAQAVSKWERNATMPDVQMLPDLSAYFGVTIDALFSLTDEKRMERIQNMLWDEREISPAVREREEDFLLELARRDPSNGHPHTLLADLENHAARNHRARAEEFAKEALRRNPMQKDAHSELVEAMGGKCADWCAANHGRLIAWYKDYLDKNPEDRGGYMWLLDQLLDDGRLEEARKYLDRMARVDGTFRTPLYRGHIAWSAGDHETAMAHWQSMLEKWPEDWMVHLSMGDILAGAGRWEDARSSYRQAFALQESPRIVDALESIAQICELQGDIPGAIEAMEEEIEVLSTDWNIVSGETLDQPRREIARLKAKLH